MPYCWLACHTHCYCCCYPCFCGTPTEAATAAAAAVATPVAARTGSLATILWCAAVSAARGLQWPRVISSMRGLRYVLPRGTCRNRFAQAGAQAGDKTCYAWHALLGYACRIACCCMLALQVTRVIIMLLLCLLLLLLLVVVITRCCWCACALGNRCGGLPAITTGSNKPHAVSAHDDCRFAWQTTHVTRVSGT
jgi:hypothetical protein